VKAGTAAEFARHPAFRDRDDVRARFAGCR
jgi:hypothetical protein